MRESLGLGHEELTRRWIVGGGPDPALDAPEQGPSIPEILERHGLRPARVAELVTDLIEPAKASALEKLGQSDRSLSIATAWLRTRLEAERATVR